MNPVAIYSDPTKHFYRQIKILTQHKQSHSKRPDMSTYPQRKYPRAKWHQYNGATYFITVCTKDRIKYFGEIVNAKIKYSRIGEYLVNTISEASSHHPAIEIPLWTVMPNHFHAIIIVNKAIPMHNVGSLHVATRYTSRNATIQGEKREILGVVVGNIKAAVTRFAHKNDIEFSWQPRFHDRIVRDWNECNNISEYIANNPDRWQSDCFYSD